MEAAKALYVPLVHSQCRQISQRVQVNVSVDLIATRRTAFITCGAEETIAHVVERHRADNFDYLPVTKLENEGRNRPTQIIGLLELIQFLDEPVDPNALVHDQMCPLSEGRI